MVVSKGPATLSGCARCTPMPRVPQSRRRCVANGTGSKPSDRRRSGGWWEAEGQDLSPDLWRPRFGPSSFSRPGLRPFSPGPQLPLAHVCSVLGLTVIHPGGPVWNAHVGPGGRPVRGDGKEEPNSRPPTEDTRPSSPTRRVPRFTSLVTWVPVLHPHAPH